MTAVQVLGVLVIMFGCGLAGYLVGRGRMDVIDYLTAWQEGYDDACAEHERVARLWRETEGER